MNLPTGVLIVAVMSSFVIAIGFGAVRRMHAAEVHAYVVRMALARALWAWEYEALQGDGIDQENADYFFDGCEAIGIVVYYVGEDDRPTLREFWRTYRLKPNLSDWIIANAENEE